MIKMKSNIPSINLGECENILKEKYIIDKNKSLLILKPEKYMNGSLFPVIQYEVYHPINKSKLDLNFCEGKKADVSRPVPVNEDFLSGLDNNICFSSISQNGTDISLEERKKELIKKYLELCGSNCDFISYDKQKKESICQCDIKNEKIIFNVEINMDYLYNKLDIENNANLGVLSCFDYIFTKEGLKDNKGSYIIMAIFFIFIIDVFIFAFKGYRTFIETISRIINYGKKNENKKNENKKNENKNINKLETNGDLRRNGKIKKNKDKKKKKGCTVKNKINININLKLEQIKEEPKKQKGKGKEKKIKLPTRKR
jgi:hypothetical protein